MAPRALHQRVRPLDEVLHVRAVLVSTVMLSPRQLTIKKTDVDSRHLRHAIVVRVAKVLDAEQAEDGPGCDRCHIAALVIEPVRVTLLRDAVADEHPSRCDERNELMRIDGDVIRGLRAEGLFGGAVFQEVAGHPVILAGAGEVLDRLAEVATMQLGATLAG